MKSPAPQRILVTRFRYIGDVLLTTPTLCAIKKRFPDAHLTFLTDAPSDEVLRDHRAIDELLVCRTANWKTMSRGEKWHHNWALLQQIRKRRFDVAINLQPGDRGGLWTRFSGAKLRAGYAHPGEKLWYYNVVIPFRFKDVPRVEQMLDSIRALGWDATENAPERDLRLPSMNIVDAEREVASKLLNEIAWNENVPNAPLVAIHVGRPVSRKTWFDDRFIVVANELCERWNARIVWLGAPEETERVQKLQSAIEYSTLCAAGKLNLKELGALLERCDLFVGIDSSPMHIASAVDTPTVSIFSYSETSVWKPRGDNHIAIQRQQSDNPCRTPHCCEIGKSPCLLAISTEDVISAVATFLDKTADERK